MHNLCFFGLAVYEESRRGSLAAESWDHTGYHAEREGIAAVRSAIRACSEPGKPDCACPAHRRLGQKDASGRWHGPEELYRARSFLMRWTTETG